MIDRSVDSHDRSCVSAHSHDVVDVVGHRQALTAEYEHTRIVGFPCFDE